MSQNPGHQVDPRHEQTRGITSHGAASTRSSSSSSVTQPFIQDSPKGGLFIISEGSQQKQKEYWDLKTAAFSSPYYDPFAEGEEKEVEIVSPVDRQGIGIPTIEAYHSDGSHR